MARGRPFDQHEQELLREIAELRDRIALLMDELRKSGRNPNSLRNAIWRVGRKDTERPACPPGSRRWVCHIH